MSKLQYRELWCEPKRYWLGLAAMVALFLVGLGFAWYMEHHGHYVTGMTNQIVWGLPHVFAIFLIIAASGALNVASIGTVFGGPMYKPLGRYSALLAVSLLAGGLVVLLLDLGRPDRLIVAMTVYNFKSIFAWNIFLYTGFFVLVGVYLWTMMDHTVNRFYRLFGFASFFWRLILTTGTGSIFGFIVAREAYDAAILAPMFIIMSFAFGLAFLNVTLAGAYWWGDREIGERRLGKLRNLLGIFVGAVLFFVLIYHLTNLYATQHHGVEGFVLTNGGIYSVFFWFGQVVIGGILPLFLIYSPAFASRSQWSLFIASMLVLLGGFLQVYVVVIGGQAFPMNIFPGKEVLETTLLDGQVSSYTPTFAEFALGASGVMLTLILVAVAARMLKILPTTLVDDVQA